MPLSLTDRRLVIIGGSSGIGLAAARDAIALGAKVVITGRDAGRLQGAASELGESAEAIQSDGSDPNAVVELFEKVGPFTDLLLCASGAKGGGPMSSLTEGELREGFETKFWVYWRCIKAALPNLSRDGSITMVGSISAKMANPGTSGLAAINAAISGMVPVLAKELAPIRVNAVSPGVIDTAWWSSRDESLKNQAFESIAQASPVGRVGKDYEAAAAAISLIVNGFITGVDLSVDGGFHLGRR